MMVIWLERRWPEPSARKCRLSIMPTFSRCAAILGLVVAGSVSLAPVAQASCVGPTVEADLDGDGQLVVTGMYFGTNCYDTGVPPNGHGVLGPPATSITVIVRQGDDEWAVAVGDADADYEFEVKVVPPPVAGLVNVEVRQGVPSELQHFAQVTLPEPADPQAGTTVVTFGKPSAGSEQVSADSSGGVPPVAIAALVGGLMGVVGIHWWLRRKTAAQKR